MNFVNKFSIMTVLTRVFLVYLDQCPTTLPHNVCLFPCNCQAVFDIISGMKLYDVSYKSLRPEF